jgi:hypothetical protein
VFWMLFPLDGKIKNCYTLRRYIISFNNLPLCYFLYFVWKVSGFAWVDDNIPHYHNDFQGILVCNCFCTACVVLSALTSMTYIWLWLIWHQALFLNKKQKSVQALHLLSPLESNSREQVSRENSRKMLKKLTKIRTPHHTFLIIFFIFLSFLPKKKNLDFFWGFSKLRYLFFALPG